MGNLTKEKVDVSVLREKACKYIDNVLYPVAKEQFGVGHTSSELNITFPLFGTTVFGRASSDTKTIELHKHFFAEAEEHYYKTIAHEYAHLVVDLLYPNHRLPDGKTLPSHGTFFQGVLLALGVLDDDNLDPFYQTEFYKSKMKRKKEIKEQHHFIECFELCDFKELSLPEFFMPPLSFNERVEICTLLEISEEERQIAYPLGEKYIDTYSSAYEEEDIAEIKKILLSKKNQKIPKRFLSLLLSLVERVDLSWQSKIRRKIILSLYNDLWTDKFKKECKGKVF